MTEDEFLEKLKDALQDSENFQNSVKPELSQKVEDLDATLFVIKQLVKEYEVQKNVNRR